MVLSGGGSASALSINEALSLTYQNNPSLNAARAQLRSYDENVPQALSGWRPTLYGSASIGHIHRKVNFNDLPRSTNLSQSYNDYTVAAQLTQTIFRGFQTVNSTRQAEAIVLAQREELKATEQSTLLNAVTAYMDVIRDTALVSLYRSDLRFQDENLRATKDRFAVGEGTRTDVAQSEAGRASSESSLNQALAQLNASRAFFVQVVGEDPKRLSANTNVASLLPKTVSSVVSVGQKEHPSIRAALHTVDAALFAVKSTEGQLLPELSLEGNLSYNKNTIPASASGNGGSETRTASVYGRLTVPIYQAGYVSSTVRQAKEDLGQTQILVDVARDEIRARAISAWGSLNSAIASISAAEVEVAAARLALEGVIEEQRVGQRTTLDVLDSQSDLVDARVTLVTAQRNKVVAAYTLLSSVGHLTYDQLNLTGPRYDASEHYNQVRDKWLGLRTPDGR
ncbi:TolC family outer membrane protein [Flexibacterium corallicola]|uniref:TolC family outer membrane protein n=1 Tax=Flexibacterium corallicola TaxID=3037259 RepID=UPI00286F15B7|nr:TolC family outer membrane protein [Pseudovibrio sp. M1P-2-3]